MLLVMMEAAELVGKCLQLIISPTFESVTMRHAVPMPSEGLAGANQT